jgi:hypothetical protein
VGRGTSTRIIPTFCNGSCQGHFYHARPVVTVRITNGSRKDPITSTATAASAKRRFAKDIEENLRVYAAHRLLFEKISSLASATGIVKMMPNIKGSTAFSALEKTIKLKFARTLTPTQRSSSFAFHSPTAFCGDARKSRISANMK